MSRRIFAVLLFFAIIPFALAQMKSNGVPASITSPTTSADGRSVSHGVPSSVTSPTTIGRFSMVPRRDHRLQDARRHTPVVAVPVFYPIYGTSFYDAATPEMEAAPEPEPAPSSDLETVRRAYLQGAHDAVTVQERARTATPRTTDTARNQQPTPKQESSNTADVSTRALTGADQSQDQSAARPSDYDATVFIFKDGHQVESNNFVIAGKVLMDFSRKPMKKISLADLDTDATGKANDERGTSFRLP